MIIKSRFVTLQNPVTVTSTTFTTLLSLNVKTKANNSLDIRSTGAIISNAAATSAKFQLLIDGVVQATSGCDTEDTTRQSPMALNFSKNVSAGFHTIEIQGAKISALVPDFRINPNNNGHLNLIVQVSDSNLPGDFALRFNGTTSRVVTTNYKGILGDNSRTFSWWMRLNPITGSMNILDYGPVGAGRFSISIEDTESNTVKISNNNLVIGWKGINNSAVLNLTDTIWHHCLISTNHGGFGTTFLFIDGIKQIDTLISGNTSDIFNTVTGNDFTIGRQFNGMIDEFAVISSNIDSLEEVNNIYNNGTPNNINILYDSSILELYYNFEEGAGAVTTDLSGKNRNGAITAGQFVSPGANH